MFLSVSLHWLGIVEWLKLNTLSMLVAFKYLNKDNDFAADVHVFAANFITISPLKKIEWTSCKSTSRRAP